MKRKIFVAELIQNAFPHAEINAGILTILDRYFYTCEKSIIADSRHVKAITSIQPLADWEKLPIQVTGFQAKYLLYLDLVMCIRVVRAYFNLQSQDVLFILGILPLSHIVLTFLNKIGRKHIFVCLHGEMEALLPRTKIGITRYYYRFTQFLFKISSGLTYLILGESVCANIKFLFGKETQYLIIDQPYLWSSEQVVSNNEVENKGEVIKLGIVGRFNNSKNVKECFKFIKGIKPLIEAGKIEIYIIGKVDIHIEEDIRELLAFYSNSPLSPEDFMAYIQKQNFILSFTDRSYYRATPSGVFFDCIKYSKPIFGLKNDYLCHYYNKYGAFGYLYDDVSEMINALQQNQIQCRRDFDSTYELLRSRTSVSAIYKIMASKFDEIGLAPDPLKEY